MLKMFTDTCDSAELNPLFESGPVAASTGIGSASIRCRA